MTQAPRRHFIICSLDEHADDWIKAAFMGAGETPVFFSPTKFFKPAYAAHVDKWGFPDKDWRTRPPREPNTDWVNEVRRYPLFESECLATKLYPTPITEASYDGSKHTWQEIDECSQWVPLWAYKKVDLNAAVKKLLRMDAQFDADYKSLLEWLKTRGNPMYLTGAEYHMLTNPGAYRHGLWYRPRRYMGTFFNASFKTY